MGDRTPFGQRNGQTAPLWRCALGVGGPLVFVVAWVLLGLRDDDYSAVHDPISELAALGASSRPAMTAGLLAFAAGAGALVPVLRQQLSTGAARAATTTSLATVAVAALPLGGFGGDTPHAVAAGVAYTSLAAIPFLAARPLAAGGRRWAAIASVAAAAAVGASLAASAVLPSGAGAAQRAGLTLGDLWLVAFAAAAARCGSWRTRL